jgi:hypothetical protein
MSGQQESVDSAWLAGSPGAVFVLAILGAFFWLSLPVTLLAVGIGHMREVVPGGWQWPAAWTGTVLTGIALDPLCLWALNTTYVADGFQWAWLVAAIGYLAASGVMITLLIAAPRSSQRAAIPAGLPAR